MKRDAPKCVLVTGATGFLGGHVLARLSAIQIPAIGIGRDTARCDAMRSQMYKIVQADLGHPIDAAQYAELSYIDAIIHCAALSAPFGPRRAFERSNVEATKNLIRFAKQVGVKRFVHLSTPSVYFAFQDQIDVAETAVLPTPVNEYARTKRLAEEAVLAAPDIHPIVLRPRGIYGPGDTTLLPRLLDAAAKRPLPEFTGHEAAIDLTFVDDVVDAILVTLLAGADIDGEIFNISGGQMLPIKQIVSACCDKAHIDLRWKEISLSRALMAVGMIERLAAFLPWSWEPPIARYSLGLFAYKQSLDISKAANLLGWRPKTDFQTGLDETFAGADL